MGDGVECRYDELAEPVDAEGAGVDDVRSPVRPCYVGYALPDIFITTTGATLAANALKVIEDGVTLRSQANLVAARTATWGASERDCAHRARPHRRADARAFREVRTRFAGCDDALLAEARKRFGVEAARACIGDVPARQRRRDVVVADLGYVFFRANPPYAKLGRVEPKNAPAF